MTGVQLNDLLRAANDLGFDQVPSIKGNSLFGTLSRIIRDDGMYIITLPNHFVVIEINEKKAYFCDNHTKEPIPAVSSARLGQQVLASHKIIKRPETVIETPKPQPTYETIIRYRCIECKAEGDLQENVIHSIFCQSNKWTERQE